MRVTSLSGGVVNLKTEAYNRLKASAYQRGLFKAEPDKWQYDFEVDYYNRGLNGSNSNEEKK